MGDGIIVSLMSRPSAPALNLGSRLSSSEKTCQLLYDLSLSLDCPDGLQAEPLTALRVSCSK